jgi:hypothetical protein
VSRRKTTAGPLPEAAQEAPQEARKAAQKAKRKAGRKAGQKVDKKADRNHDHKPEPTTGPGAGRRAGRGGHDPAPERGGIHPEPFLDITDAEIVEHDPGLRHRSAEPDPALLERSRAQWELGDWDRLAGLAALPLEDHPDRAKLALLAGVGLAQTGDLSGARVQVRRAQDWGCPRDLVARVLVAGVHNSLGRMASLHGDEARALRHFETSVGTVSPRADAQVLGRARTIQQKARLGQLPQAAALLDREVTDLARAPEQSLTARLARLEQTAATLLQQAATKPVPPPVQSSVKPPAAAKPQNEPAERFAPEVLERFRAHLPGWQAGHDLPRLLETKSLPRSGLHFLHSCLKSVLGPRYAFCEWYHEPGCCRRQPCALAGAELAVEDPARPRLRMVKSHDFDLGDADYPLPPGVRRLVLIRDPLMILTSWWMLEEISRHADVLRANGIRYQQLFFAHDPVLQRAVHAVLEREFVPVPGDRLARWLQAKTTYINGFIDKWVAPTRSQALSRTAALHGTEVVRYSDLPAFIDTFLDAVLDRPGGLASAGEKAALARLKAESLARFAPRGSPFDAPVPQVARLLQDEAGAFRTAAGLVEAHCGPGVFG